MLNPRKPLSGILPGRNGGDDDIFDRFDAVAAADDFAPLPRGTYTAVAVSGRRVRAGTGTPGYTVEFRVTEGEHTGRRVWLTKYFTDAALGHTKRDLAKFGIDTKAKLDRPFPADRFVCKLTVVLRRQEDGTERNEVRHFDVVGVQDPEADPFAPNTASEPAEGDADFPFGANAEGGGS